MKEIKQILIHVSGKKEINKYTFCLLCEYERYSRKEIANFLETSSQNIYYYFKHQQYANQENYKKCVEILKQLEIKRQDYVKELINSQRTNN